MRITGHYTCSKIGQIADIERDGLFFSIHIDKEPNWTIAHFIEFLKRKNQFPFRAVRAIDSSIDTKEAVKFVPNRVNYINLNPVFIVCLLDKNTGLQTYQNLSRKCISNRK